MASHKTFYQRLKATKVRQNNYRKFLYLLKKNGIYDLFHYFTYRSVGTVRDFTIQNFVSFIETKNSEQWFSGAPFDWGDFENRLVYDKRKDKNGLGHQWGSWNDIIKSQLTEN